MVNYNKNELSFTHPQRIESLYDLLDVVSRPHEYLSEILDHKDEGGAVAPLGRSHQGSPRPFPYGLWFRGQSDAKYAAIPSAFRTYDEHFIDEREMFTDLRLRSSNANLRGLDNIELMCLMQHHALPTRLLDWSESPLVAAFFATSFRLTDNESSIETDRSIYVVNAYRLNAITNLAMQADSNIFHPQDIDPIIRSVMAEHTYVNNVLEKVSNLENAAIDKLNKNILDNLQKIYSVILEKGKSENLIYDLSANRLNNSESTGKENYLLSDVYRRLSCPVAVMPRRSHPRMDAQLSCFTIHGGKVIYGDVITRKYERENTRWNFLPAPVHFYEIQDSYRPLSGKSFIRKFVIAASAVPRIIAQLDRLGITEAMLFQDLENQSNFVKRRWTTKSKDDIFLEINRTNWSNCDIERDN